MAYGNGKPRIMQPGQVAIGVEAAPGNWASPVVLQIEMPDGFKAIAFGGLSREEALAAPIFAMMCADPNMPEEVTAEMVANKALEMAETLLSVSARRAQARAAAQAQQKPMIEGA